jgi:hypothetical protein
MIHRPCASLRAIEKENEDPQFELRPKTSEAAELLPCASPHQVGLLQRVRRETHRDLRGILLLVLLL